LHRSGEIALCLNEWLRSNWILQHQTNFVDLPLLIPSVPKQINFVDCGLFTLKYAEEVVKHFSIVTLKNIEDQTLPGFSSTMFSVNDIKVTSLY